MKLLSVLFCASGLSVGMFLTACDHLATDGNATKFYQPYSGTRTNWPTSPEGGFVTFYDKFPIYHGPPPSPYRVLGRFDRPNIPLFRAVACARYHQANAIMMVEQDVLQSTTDNGVIISSGQFAFQTPSTTKIEVRTQGTAYCIIIDGQPVPDAPKPVQRATMKPK